MNVIERMLFMYFLKYEMKKKKYVQKEILPKYVMKRHIIIKSNGVIVFDNKGGTIPVPDSIQYSIKNYGYPDLIKANNKTPLIYNIKSETSAPIKLGETI